MNTTASNKDFKKTQQENTTREAETMERNGMTKLTPEEAKAILQTLGFKICKDHSFRYYNTANERHYKAYSVYIVDIKTGLSFANIDFGKTPEETARRAKLQEIRRCNFGFDGVNIWDL